MTFKEFIQKPAFPVALTILFSMFAWSVNQEVDRLNQAPMIEYSTSAEQVGLGLHVTYTIANITRDKLFEDIDLFIVCEAKDSIKKSGWHIFPPMKVDTNARLDTSKTSLTLHLGKLQPKCSVEIQMVTNAKTAPALRFSSKTAAYFSDSFDTYLFKHEMCILAIFAGVVVILIFLAILFSN